MSSKQATNLNFFCSDILGPQHYSFRKQSHYVLCIVTLQEGQRSGTGGRVGGQEHHVALVPRSTLQLEMYSCQGPPREEEARPQHPSAPLPLITCLWLRHAR